MASIGNLHPILETHSIKEAVVTFFLASKIMKPISFKNLIESEFKDKFQQFDNVKQVQIKVSNKQNPEVREIEDTGFKFVQFLDGKAANIIQGMNEENRYFFSFHTLKYSNWTDFKDQFTSNAEIISNFQPGHYILAYSLHYIDEFIWDNNKDYDAKLIFKDSDYLPKDAFNSSVLEYNLNLDKKNENIKYFDRLVINISDKIDQKNIMISHNISFVIEEEPILFAELIKDVDFDKNIRFAHDANKMLLTNLLEEEVCKLINI